MQVDKSILFLLLLFFSCKEERPYTKPIYAPLTEAVYTSLTINAEDMYQAYSPVTGIIEKVYVEEGSRVEKGAPILKIKDLTAKYNTQSAQLSVELARNNIHGKYDLLAEMESEIRIAQNRLYTDSLLYVRQRNLWEKEVGSRNDYDQRKLAFEVARDNVNVLENKYQRTKKQLELQLAQSEVNLKNVRNTARDFIVKSRIDGMVYQLSKQAGELVNLQEPICEIGSTSAFVIEMDVDEVDISKIKTGQRIWLTLEAFGDQVMEARLTKIFPKMNERTQTFKVEGIFLDPPAPLYPGLTGESNIVISEREAVMVIPNEYLTDDDKVETDTGFVQVIRGLNNMTYTEILNGIDTSTKILYPIQ